MQVLLKSQRGKYALTGVFDIDGLTAYSLIRLEPSNRVFGLTRDRMNSMRVYAEVDIDTAIQPYVSVRYDDTVEWITACQLRRIFKGSEPCLT